MTDATDSTPTSIKPGWQTTEFWLSLAATALTVLFASGALTSSTSLAIAGMAATVLTALGYKVSRTLVKTAAALALVALALGASSCTAAQARQVAAAGVVAALDCETAHLDATTLEDAKRLADALVQRWIGGGPAASTDAIAADLAPIRSDLGRCAVTGAIAAATSLAAPAPGTTTQGLFAPPPAPAPDQRASWQLAARAAGWPPVRLPGGQTL